MLTGSSLLRSHIAYQIQQNPVKVRFLCWKTNKSFNRKSYLTPSAPSACSDVHTKDPKKLLRPSNYWVVLLLWLLVFLCMAITCLRPQKHSSCNFIKQTPKWWIRLHKKCTMSCCLTIILSKSRHPLVQYTFHDSHNHIFTLYSDTHTHTIHTHVTQVPTHRHTCKRTLTPKHM